MLRLPLATRKSGANQRPSGLAQPRKRVGRRTAKSVRSKGKERRGSLAGIKHQFSLSRQRQQLAAVAERFAAQLRFDENDTVGQQEFARAVALHTTPQSSTADAAILFASLCSGGDNTRLTKTALLRALTHGGNYEAEARHDGMP